MATYKYQQNLFEGASAGYVQYNITPDFGTVLTVGESFEITGKVYCGDMKRYGLSVEAALTTGGFGAELGRVEKTISKGGSASFSLRCIVTDRLADNASERGFSGYITFMLADRADFSSGAYTRTSEAQKLSLLTHRLSPVIRGVHFTDTTGAYDHFGGAVAGKSDLTAVLDIALDPLDPSLRIEQARISFGRNVIDIPAGNISGNALYIGVPSFSGEFSSYTLLAMDNKQMTGGYTGGAFTAYPYEAPRLESFTDAELAERYEAVINDTGEETVQLSDSGPYLWANFSAGTARINGRNTWTIGRSYAEYGAALPESVTVLSGSDGEEMTFRQDQAIFPRSIEFSANKRYTIEITLSDFFGSVILRFDVDKAGGYFNVEKHGVAAGMRSTATQDQPKFESAYPVYPYKGIVMCPEAVAEIPLELDASGKFRLYRESSSPLRLLQYGNIVYLDAELTPVSSISGSTTEHIIATLPEGFAPKYPQTYLCQGTGVALWMLRVYSADNNDYPSKITFGRYRSGDSYASCVPGNWLPISVNWICGGTLVQEDDGTVKLIVYIDGAAVISGAELTVDSNGGASIPMEYLSVYTDGTAVIG